MPSRLPPRTSPSLFTSSAFTSSARALVIAGLFSLGACAVDSTGGTDWADCGEKCDDLKKGVPPVKAPALLINQLDVLGELERSGFDLGAAMAGDGSNNESLLASSPRFESLVEILDGDIDEIDAADSRAGVGMAFAHRLFDIDWLRAADARFRLVAITNRMDLAHRTPGACGEVRFVYRLMYETQQGTSRLPMTIMAVHEQPELGGSCAEVASAWLEGRDDAEALRQGPLADIGPALRFELNLQAVRWPASIRPDLGGHAEYLLRVVETNGDTLEPILLPDTIRTDLSGAEKEALAEWISENVEGIDRGTAAVPAEFLTTRAYSVSPHGLARGANRPFFAAFPNPESTFGNLDLSQGTRIKSPGGLLRRLDTMSCQGCHQSRSLAGFHILGEDDADALPENTLEVGSSPHLNDELRWRHDQLQALASSSSTEESRPYAERDPQAFGGYGVHCGLGDPSFESWTCALGFECTDHAGDEVGVCVPSSGRGAGDACESASILFEEDPHRDRAVGKRTLSCSVPTGAGRCSTQSGGFPNGACSASCGTPGEANEDAICGIAVGSGFNNCVGAGRPFAECLQNVVPVFRRRCDAVTPCGDDYVCAGVPGAAPGVGACMPPYFIFQGRVDGHPKL